MDSISEFIAYLALVVSFLSALIALLQKNEAKRSADAAERSAVAAERQTAIAEDAATSSRDSALAAREAASTARRSLELEEEQLAARQQADVRVKHWSGSRGLIVQNCGPATASNVVAYRFDNKEVNTNFATIAAGDEVEMGEGWRNSADVDWPEQFPLDGQRADHYAMRLTWTDAALQERDTGWVYVPKMTSP